jgi:diguanylate cyclase (GGDEF)-like protein
MKLATRRCHWLLCLGVSAWSAPVEATPTRPIRFDRLSLEEGLSQSTVMDVLQDRRGYIWLATEDGLNRFDGLSFKVYKHDNADAGALPSSFIWDVEEDAGGDLWIATAEGLARWDHKADRIVRQEVVAGPIRTLRYVAKEGRLWMGTRDRGLLCLDLSRQTLATRSHDDADPRSLSDDHVFALHLDRKGRLWVGTDAGLNRLDGDGGFTRFVSNSSDAGSLADGQIRAIREDETGALWVGTRKGLHRLDAAAGRFERFHHDPADPGSLSEDHVRAILSDASGRLWIGTDGGLDLLDAAHGRFTHYHYDAKDPHSLADDHVLSLAQDRGGVLWVGTRLGGVHKWNPLSWQFGHVAPQIDNPKGLPSGHVTSFSEDRAGRLWIGTFDAGLHVMDRTTGEITAYRADARKPQSIASDRVMSLRHDHRGQLWIGSLDAGLTLLRGDGASVSHYRHDPKRGDSLAADGVTALLEDRDGRLWAGTYGGGLDRFDPDAGRFTHFRYDAQDAASLSGDRVSSLAEAADGSLWVGTMETGLNRLDRRSGRFERYQHHPGDPRSLPSNAVHALLVDADGGLWIGTHGGLSRMAADGLSFDTYTTKNGLPSDVVYAVRSDRMGRLWMSTNSGLSCFDPRNERFVNYGVSDGLQATEFNFGAWYQSASGELFFGGVNGFNAFFPERLRRVEEPPPVVLTAVNVDHRPMGGPADRTSRIGLGYRDKVLALEFAALDYTAPVRNAFAYKLEGFDPDWVPLRGRRGVTYTNLGPGHYTFRLRGANSDGRWNDEGLAVAVDVAAAPWASPPAYGLYALMLAGSIVGLVRVQKRKFEREAEYAHALEKRVSERTRELSERQLELERLNVELGQASVTDSLTGVANRRFLTEYLEREVALLHRRYQRLGEEPPPSDVLDLAFVMIDLDHFKTVNDSAGHAAGDAVLRQLCDLLKTVSRGSDIIVRWGGDELLLVARELSNQGLAELVERIRSRVAHHVFDVGEGRVVRTSCSVGYASYPFFREQLDALSWEQVISVADRALYVAKASGRNAWVGLHPGITALPIQGLFGAICHRTQQLVREGKLRVTTSLTGSRGLVWDAPDQDTAAQA